MTNPRGKELYYSIQESQLLHLSTGEPTYWPSDTNKTPDLIDFCIIKCIDKNLLKASSCPDLSSDHSPIIVTLDRKIKNHSLPPPLHTKRTNWRIFKEIVKDNLPPNILLKSNTDLEEAINTFNTVIQQAAWKSTPKVNQTEQKCTMTETLRKTIKEKRKLRSLWQSTRHPIDKQNFNRAAKNLKKNF